MRKLLVVVSILAAACGGGSSSDGGGPTPVTGTIAGATFAPADVKALVIQNPADAGNPPHSTTCSANGLTFAATGLALELTSYANACGDFASDTCAFHKSAVTVTVLLALLDAAPPYDAPAIAPGSYAIGSTPAGTVGQGYIGYAQATVIDPTCNGGNPTPLKSQSGTLRIDSVTASSIGGHLSVTFQNGAGTLAGDFTAPRCTESPNICTLVGNATAAYLSGQPTMLYCAMPGTCP